MMRCSMMPPFDLETPLRAQREAGLLRQRQTITLGDGVRIVAGGREYLNFSSNDYLGLAQHSLLKVAFAEGIERYGCGSGASALVTGYSSAHAELEAELADWLGTERAILFNCGFSANQALLKALLGAEHILWQDKLNHASLQEMGALLPCTQRRFAHNDLEHLSRLLEPSKGLIVSEGIFSMDGDVAPWPELAKLASASGNWLMIDDAHGVGVWGKEGRGTLSALNVGSEKLPIQLITFGKAFGVAGAAICGSSQLIEYLVNFARAYVYSTQMPAAQAYAIHAALRLIRGDEGAQRRAALQHNIAYFRQGAELRGLPLSESRSAIQPILIGSSEATVHASLKLREQGIWATPIRPPTVPKNSARLRLTLTAAHGEAEINRLLNALEAAFVSS